MKLTGETRGTRGKPRPSATLSTTNPTWNDPGSNPDLRGERPATNRLSHCTALDPRLRLRGHWDRSALLVDTRTKKDKRAWYPPTTFFFYFVKEV